MSGQVFVGTVSQLADWLATGPSPEALDRIIDKALYLRHEPWSLEETASTVTLRALVESADPDACPECGSTEFPETQGGICRSCKAQRQADAPMETD